MAGGNSNPTTTPSTNASQPSWAGGPVSTSFQPKDLGAQLGGDLQKVYSGGPKVFNENLYAGMGAETRGGLADMLGVDTSKLQSGLGGAMDYYSSVARGEQMGQNDPNFARMRQNMIDDTMTGVNQAFGSFGRNLGGSHMDTMTSSLADSLAGLDYQRLQDDYARRDSATAALPSLYSAMQAPAQTRLGVGQMFDQDAQAMLTGRNDLFRRQNDAGMTHIAGTINTLNGGSGQDGNGGVMTPDPAWWQQLLGFGANVAGGALGALF